MSLGKSKGGLGAQAAGLGLELGDSVLATVVREHLHAFLDRLATQSAERTLPGFVLRALQALTTCGDLTRGFVRLRCADCRADRVVPFS